MFKPSYKKTTRNGCTFFLPVIKEYAGGKLARKKVIAGDPVLNKQTAIRYAQIELNDFYARG